MWTQKTYVNGELAYEPKKLDDTMMMKRFVQIIFLKQAGENIIVHALEHDDMFEVTQYTVTRELDDRIVVHEYTRD